MSFGSRANQVKPEALVILFEQLPETAFLRVTAGPRPHTRGDSLVFDSGNLFSRVRI